MRAVGKRSFLPALFKAVSSCRQQRVPRCFSKKKKLVNYTRMTSFVHDQVQQTRIVYSILIKKIFAQPYRIALTNRILNVLISLKLIILFFFNKG